MQAVRRSGACPPGCLVGKRFGVGRMTLVRGHRYEDDLLLAGHGVDDAGHPTRRLLDGRCVALLDAMGESAHLIVRCGGVGEDGTVILGVVPGGFVSGKRGGSLSPSLSSREGVVSRRGGDFFPFGLLWLDGPVSLLSLLVCSGRGRDGFAFLLLGGLGMRGGLLWHGSIRDVVAGLWRSGGHLEGEPLRVHLMQEVVHDTAGHLVCGVVVDVQEVRRLLPEAVDGRFDAVEDVACLLVREPWGMAVEGTLQLLHAFFA